MATAPNTTSLTLNISGTQSVALKRGEKTNVTAKAGQRYRVVKEGEEAAAKDVAASQQGQDLLLAYADGTQVLLVSFYEACKAEQCAVDMPGAKGTGSSGGYVINGDSPAGASLSDGGKLVYAFGDTPSMAGLTQGATQARGFTQTDSFSTYIPTNDAAGWTPVNMGLGALGTALLMQQQDKDKVPPTLKISSNVASLKRGETATITFTFSEMVAGFDASDIVAVGGVISALQVSSTDPKVYTATFTPTVGSNTAANITVATGTYIDMAGNTGGAGTTPSISIDTEAPSLAITSNVTSLRAGQTATITFSFSEDPGSSFVWNGTSGDVMVTGGTLGAIGGTGLTRTAIFTPTADSTTAASITVASGAYTDPAGNTGSAGTTPSISINTLPTIIKGSVVAGPVLAGNGLTAVAYKADGTVLASGPVNDDGTFTLVVGSDYLGPVLVKVSDTNNSPDYFDEATGAPKDLTTDLRALTVIPAAGTYNVSVNVLTELAVRNLGLSGGDTGNSSTTFANVSQTQIVQANQQVAAAVGLTQDLVLGAAPVAIITTTGAINDQTNDYGRLLAALSGAELGSSTTALIDDLASKMQSTQTQAVGQVLETLLEGAAKVNLVAVVSDITNQKSTAITIDAVSLDNRLSPVEMIEGVQVQGTAAAGASLIIAWSDSTGTATATGTRSVTADSQGRWSTNFTSVEMPALGATTLKASAGTQVATRSIFLDEPLAPAIKLTQTSGGSANLTNNGQVEVSGILSGAGWDYSLDAGNTWTPGSGNGFTLSGDGVKQVLVRQNIGGHFSQSSTPLNFELDTSLPTAMSLTLPTANSGNSSNSKTVTVSGVESGATWQYSTDGGTTWATGTGTTFTLPENSYAAGSIKVRQTDAAGNTSTAAASTAAITIDTTAPTAMGISMPTGNSSGSNNSGVVTVSGIESGATWQYSTDGGTTWTTGTGTTFRLLEASYASGAIKVRQTDAAGNTSTAAASTAAITIDTTAPIALGLNLPTANSGNSSNSKTVTVSGVESGATWQYTTDGGTTWATGTGTTFTLPEASYAAGSIKVRQTDAAGNTSTAAASTAAITIDTTAPTAMGISLPTANSSGSSNSTTVTVSGVESGATWQYSTDGGTTWATGTGTNFTLPEANYATGAIKVRQTDAAGNTSTAASSTSTISIDTTAPTAMGISLPTTNNSGSSNSTSVTVSGVESDATWQYSTDGGTTWATGTGTTFTLPEASYAAGSIKVRQTDAAGNTSTAAASTAAISIDTTAPSAMGISLPPANSSGSSNSTTVTVSGVESGATWQYSTDGGTTWATGTGTSFTLPEANYATGAIKVRQTDAAGNTSTAASSTAAISIDTTAPTAMGISLPTANSSGSSNSTSVTVSGVESGATWQYSTDGGTTWATGTGTSFTLPEASYSAGSIKVRQTDAAGNTSTAAASTAAISIDTTAPTAMGISLPTANSSGSSNSTSVTVSGVESGATWQYSTDGGTTWATGTGTNFTLPEANYATGAIKVRQTDAAGNTSTAAASTAAITIDTSAPTAMSLSMPTANSSGRSNSTSVTVSGVESGATWQYSTDGGTTWATGTGTTFTLPEASYAAGSIKVRQTDAAGNTSTAASSTAAISIDTTAPTAMGISLPTANSSGSSNSTSVTVSGVEPDATWQYSTDGGTTWATGTGTTFTLPEASYAAGSIKVRQTDAAGNTSTAAASTAAISIDTTAPSAMSLSMPTANSSGSSNSSTVTVSGVESGATWQYSTDGGTTWATGTGTNFTLPEANYATGAIKVRQTDAAGNTSTAAASTAAISIDTTAPSAMSLSMPTANSSGSSNSSTVTVSGVESGATWQYSTNGGTTWVSGTGTTFTLPEASYASGAIKVRQTDAAGNTSTAAASTAAISIDTTAPTVSITSNASSLGANATATLTFTFSEAVSNFTATEVNVVGGTLSNFAGSGTSYTATFTPDAGLSGPATVSVLTGAIADVSGNASAAASNTVSLVVDTLAPTLASISSSRASLMAAQTATLTIVLSEDSTDFGVNDLLVVGGSLSNFSGSGRNYSATFTPDNNRIEAGSVSAKKGSFSDAAINLNEGGNFDGLVLGIQTLRPTATLTARQSQLGLGDTTTIDITLSEKSSDFVLADLTPSHGTLSAFTSLGDGLNYRVTFTPEASYTGSGGVTVADGSFTNAAGNINGGALQAANTLIAIDTTPPTVAITSDVAALSIGQSAKITFTFNKDPGETFDAKDITVNGGTLSKLVNHTGTVWSAMFTPTDGSSGQASISIGAGAYTDASGNKGTEGLTPTIAIDTQSPTAESLLPGNATTVLPGQALVLSFNEAVRLGTGNFVLVNDTASTRVSMPVSNSAIVLSNDGKTLTITPSTGLVAGQQYHVEATPGSLLDAAGNAWAGIAASSTWAGSNWHFTAATPSVSLNKISTDNRVNASENTAGVVVSGTIESNTAGMVAAFLASDFTVTLTPQGGGSAITAQASSYNTTTGAWSLTLASGALANGKTYDVSVFVTGTTGAAASATATSAGKLLTDFTAATPTLTLLIDTGRSNSDGKTALSEVQVDGLEQGSSWQYKLDSGTWQEGSGTLLKAAAADGAHTVEVRQTDAAGNVSSTGSLSFTLDTTAARPVINVVATDNTLNASEVGSAITGTAEANAIVALKIGSDKELRVVEVTADGSGNWTYTLTNADIRALGYGPTQILATQTDVAGNRSYKAIQNLTVDTIAPTVTIEAKQVELTSATPTTEITFTLSEKSTDFTASSVTVTGGTLSNFTGSDTSYTATFTPTNAATTAGKVSVAAGAFHDTAGNGNAVASNSIDLKIDTAAPTVAITSNVTTLQAGDVANLTFTLSEASYSFTQDSVTVVGGTLSKLMANAAGTVYSGVFTPTEGFAGAGSVSVANGAFRDVSYNANADGQDTNNTVAFTIQAAPVTLDITSNKTALKAGETATISFTFSSAPTGFAAADITVAGGTLGALTTVDSTHYTATFTPTANTASGTASVGVSAGTYTGLGGNLGEAGEAVEMTLDTLVPTLKSTNPDDNGYLAAGNALVATFTEDVSAGTGNIRLVDSTASTTTTYAITDSAIVISGNQLTLTPSTALVSGHNYSLSIDNTALVDAAGNAYAGIANTTSWNFAATNLSTTLSLVTGDGLINASEKTAAMAANGLVLSGTVSSLNPAVLGALRASDIVVRVTLPDQIDNDGGGQKVLTFAASTYDSSTGAWSAEMPKTWEYTHYDWFLFVRYVDNTQTRDTLTNGHTDNISVTVTGRNGTAAAGLSTTLSDSMTVDLTNPATPTISLSSDTGSSNSDEMTRNGLINVSSLEAGGSWQYSLDNGVNWQPGSGSSLALTNDGTYVVQVKQSDAAGNNSSTSTSLAVTLDTAAKAPVVNAIATDNIINASEASSAITGTAEANASVSLVIGANTRTVTANTSGVWSYTLVAADITAMGQGDQAITITQTDKAGNASGKTSALVEVDTVRPTVTLANTGSTSLLAGQSATITATLSELNDKFSADSLTVSGGTLSTLKVDSTGLVYTGTFTPNTDSTTAGSIQLAAGTLFDAAGNSNASASNALALTINTVRPTVAITSNVASGTALHAGDTATLTFTLSAAATDFSVADVAVTGGTLSNFAGSGTTYTATFTPDNNSKVSGSVGVGNDKFTSAAGNANADSADTNNNVTFTIATVRPTVYINSDLGTLASGQTAAISFKFSEEPGTSFTASDITVTGGTLSALEGSGRFYTALFTPTAGFAGAASITVANGSYTSTDGSLGQAGLTPEITIDAVAPTVAISRSGSGTLGADQTDTITFNFSEAPGSSFTLDDVYVSGGTLSAPKAVSATQYVATFTPTASAAGTAKIGLGSKAFSDVAGNFNADGADANNTLTLAYATAIIPAVTVNASDVPTLSLAYDSGTSSTDRITNKGVVNVGGLVAGATWEYSTNGGNTWTAGTGTSFTLATAGTYSALQVRQSDGTNISNVGSLAGAALDFRAAYTSTVSLALARDTSALSSGTVTNTDGVTYDGTVNVSGLAQGDTWRYSADNGMNWVAGVGSTIEALGASGTDTRQQLVVEVTDAAGNTNIVKYAFTLDRKSPDAPNVTLTTDPNDGGAIVAATNLESGAVVEYRLNNGSGYGNWTSTYTAPTTAGNYNLQVKQVDVAGNANVTTLSFAVQGAPATPLQLSSLTAQNAGFVINGQEAYAQSGMSLSSAGDVNGDGLADLFVGAPYASVGANYAAGRSYVVFGKASAAEVNLSSVVAQTGGFVINGESFANYLQGQSGYSVSAPGDVNGDGLADLLIGAWNINNNKGRSYVVFGKTSGTSINLSTLAAQSLGFVINGQSTGEYIGLSVGSAGDVNGDGLADFIVGSSVSTPAAGQAAGRSYVVFGKTSVAAIELSDVAKGVGGFVINGQCANDYSGSSISCAGDVNGDGLADLIVGARYSYEGTNWYAGRSYVVFGKTSGTSIDLSAVANQSGGFVINGECAGDSSGYSVSAAGDVNGDGLADLIVGAPASSALSGGSNAGRSYVVFGKTSGAVINLSAVAAGVGGFVINGQCGIIPPKYDDYLMDELYHHHTFHQILAFDSSGWSVSTAGDVNGDGLADMIIGAPDSTTAAGERVGRSFVVFGKTSGAGVDLSAVAGGVGGFVIEGQSAGMQTGYNVSAAGDVNGDGLADLIVAAPTSKVGANDYAGQSYVIFGNTTGAFGQTQVDWLGTDAAETQSDGGVTKTLVAGAGNDTLTATAASVLYGGAGNDSFTINRDMIGALESPMGQGGNVNQLARIDGGSGVDKIVLSGSGLTFDLSKVANQAAGNPNGGSRIDSIEAIDLTGLGNNTLVLSAKDVMDMADMNLYNSGNGWTGLDASVTRHQLRVDGNAGDVIKLTNEWVAVKSTATVGGITYKVYNAGTGAQLLVNAAMTIDTPPQVVNLSGIAGGIGGFVINGHCATDSSGFSVSNAGDVNGDGLNDLIVGAPYSDPVNGIDAGRSYVVFGKTATTGIDLSAVAGGTGGFVINGQGASDLNGASVSGVGDVNGDGLADLIVGAKSSDPVPTIDGGRSYVVFGKTATTGVNLSAVAGGTGGFVINGQCGFDLSGVSVSSAGDVNGDGLSDVIIGTSPGLQGRNAGRSYVVFGKTATSGINLSAVEGGTGGFVIYGQCDSDLSGISVSSAGDVNADGLADLIVGAFNSDPDAGMNAGRSYVVFGKTATTVVNLSAVAGGSGGFVINGQCMFDISGNSVSNAGDVNGDGLADLIVGAPNGTSLSGRISGRSYVVFGKTATTGIDLSAVMGGTGGFVINGQCESDYSGLSVSSAGDVNGDGLADLIVGAYRSDPLSVKDAGRSYVVFGKTSSTGVDLSAVAGGTGGFAINGQTLDDWSGYTVSSAGDVNGDGLADLIVGAYNNDPNAVSNAGRSYVIFGSTSGAFNQSDVDWMGTSGADTQSDAGVAKTLVAGAGDDALTATAASVLYGGAGNDSFTINSAMITALQSPMGSGGNVNQLARIDGGSGKDKIILSGSLLTFDLTLVANQAGSNIDGGSRIDSIEMIDITGSGNNTLKLTAFDVLDMGSANLFETNGRQQLLVMGNQGDTVDLADGTGTSGTGGWTKVTKAVKVNGVECYAWTNNTSLVTVYVQSGVVVN